MSDLLIEVRYVADDTRESPGRIVGTLLTYGERARDRAERFLADALQWDAEGGILINEQHIRAASIVRAFPYLEGRELKIDAVVPNTQRGRDAITNIREGVLTGLSVEFERNSVKSQLVGGIREIRAAKLVGAALVDLSSYKNSLVEVRESALMDYREVLRWL